MFGLRFPYVRRPNGPLFLVRAACSLLGAFRWREAQNSLDADELHTVTIDNGSGPQDVTAVTKDGLLRLIFMLDTAMAKRIADRIIEEIETIRHREMPGSTVLEFINAKVKEVTEREAK